MQWHSAFPSKIAKKCGALVFLVGWKRNKVEDQKICERKCSEWNDDEHEQAMILFGLQKQADGWDDIRDMHRESELAKAAIDEADGRDGVGKNQDEG